MKIKQILAGLALMLVMPLSFATTLAQTAGFSDVPSSHPNYAAIMDLKERGIIGGYPDGTFKPDQVVNRVEALKIILLGAAIVIPSNTGTGGFSDTMANEWYSKYLLKAKALGIVAGYPDGTFKPTQTVNLVENLKMLINTRNINLDTLIVSENPYADALKDQWYVKFVAYAKEHHWITPDAKNMIYPAQGMTRGKLAQLLYNSIQEEAANQTSQQQSQQQADQEIDPNAMIVNIQELKFVKDNMTIGKGTKVTWINKDSNPHTVVSDEGLFASQTLANGQNFSYTFTANGTFHYHCGIHPTMTGMIVVKNPIEVPTI